MQGMGIFFVGVGNYAILGNDDLIVSHVSVVGREENTDITGDPA